MVIKTYQSAAEFLQKVQPILEQDEAANNLMLGLSPRLQRFPERLTTQPFLATVEDEGEIAVAALMTPPQRLILYSSRVEMDAAFEILARHLLDNNWPLPAVLGPSEVSLAFAQTWASVTGQPYQEGLRERIYRLDQVIWPEINQGSLRQATAADTQLAVSWFVAFLKEALAGAELDTAREDATNRVNDGDLFLWEDGGQVVSMAARSRPTLHGSSVGPVYTPPEARGHGYASSCVASLSQLILDSGKQFCCLFTDLANPTSNSIYQKIGYRPVCDFNEYILGPAQETA